MFGALLCYTNQNLHHYDLDLKYDHVKLEQRIKVCAVVMHQVCHRFNDGEQAFTPKDIHEVTKIPQQIINHAVKDLAAGQGYWWKSEAGRRVVSRNRSSCIQSRRSIILPMER